MDGNVPRLCSKSDTFHNEIFQRKMDGKESNIVYLYNFTKKPHNTISVSSIAQFDYTGGLS